MNEFFDACVVPYTVAGLDTPSACGGVIHFQILEKYLISNFKYLMQRGRNKFRN